VNGTIVAPGEATVVIPLLVARVAICGASRVPAAWICPVISASASDTVSGKSVISRVAA
jgi:hypothetical protein